MGIKVRTISTLPNTNSIGSSDLLQISHPIDKSSGVYTSNSVEFSVIKENIENYTAKNLKDTYHLLDSSDNPINVRELSEEVYDIGKSEYTFQGNKTFSRNPRGLDQNIYDMTDEYTLTNVKQVKSLISEQGQYYSTASWLKQNPLITIDDEGKSFNGSRYTEKDSDNPFYYWHISDGQNDSSFFEDNTGNNTVKISENGILNIYGWLADDAQTLAQESWVGLFTKIYIESAKKDQWVPISVQPWIQGKKSAIMQYVCFNGIGVTKGTELKIVSGFKVNGKNSGLGSGNSLLFKEFGYTSNTFIGYVIQK